jgi:tRNA/tmRNA/rRNA uracil-C5-methylase (TrmA/RlmC/RlmD family)
VNEALREVRATEFPAFGKEKVEIAVDMKGETVLLKNRAHAAMGFQQINAEQNENLKRVVAESVGPKAERVLELYCGDGNLTFAYLPQVKEVMAIDASEPSIQLARQQKPEGAPVAFMNLAVNTKLPRQLPPEFRKKYDTLIVDPPRQGMDGGLQPWLHPGLERVIYTSCSPVSFSKDTQALRENFMLHSLQPLDMFPHTRHIEFVAVFLRSSFS